MEARQPLPRLWMMTDERQGDALWRALERLPRGSGVVFRHYRLEQTERRRLFGRVRKIARARRLMLVLAGSPALARAWKADGSHGRGRRSCSFRSAPVHDLVELRTAERNRADLLFVSPVFATRSHPGARPLGVLRLRLLTRSTRLPVVALGGMDRRKARRVKGLGVHGWAAIDSWSKD